MEQWLLRLLMKVTGTGSRQLLCLLSLPDRPDPTKLEGDVAQLGAMKARNAESRCLEQ